MYEMGKKNCSCFFIALEKLFHRKTYFIKHQKRHNLLILCYDHVSPWLRTGPLKRGTRN